MSFGNSVRFVGTEELRKSVGVHLQWLLPEPRFLLGHSPGFVVYEAYGEYTWGKKPKQAHPFQAIWDAGALALGRWEFGAARRTRFFAEAGWGFAVHSATSVDLDSRLNSTPTIGVGLAMPSGRDEVQLTLRLLHFSNAGTKGGNKGHNRLMLILSRRF